MGPGLEAGIVCPICNDRFPSNETFLQHMANDHLGKRSEFQCCVCSLVFMSKSILCVHLKIVHSLSQKDIAHIIEEQFHSSIASSSQTLGTQASTKSLPWHGEINHSENLNNSNPPNGTSSFCPSPNEIRTYSQSGDGGVEFEDEFDNPMDDPPSDSDEFKEVLIPEIELRIKKEISSPKNNSTFDSNSCFFDQNNTAPMVSLNERNFKEFASPKNKLNGFNRSALRVSLDLIDDVPMSGVAIQCSGCFQSFSCISDLKSHFKFTHGDKANERCSTSSTPSSTDWTTNEDKPLVYRRQVSRKRLKSGESLQRHNSKINGKNDAQHTCKVCDKDFRSVQSMKRHLREIHQDESKSNKICQTCGLKFSRTRNLLSHLKQTGHRLKESDFKGSNHSDFKGSNQSDFKGSNQSYFEDSNQSHDQGSNQSNSKVSNSISTDLDTHGEGQSNRKNLVKLQSVISHLKNSNTSDVEQDHSNVSESNSQTFRGSEDSKLKNSNKKINSAKDKSNTKLTCSVCEKVFSGRSIMQRHFLRLHSDLKEFECSQCPQKFALKSDLKTHIKRKHDVNGDRSSVKSETSLKGSKICHVCGKVFTRRFETKRHIAKVHDKTLSFACEECPNRFSIQRDLARHIKSEHKPEMVNCSVCSKKFNKFKMLGHLRIVHTPEIAMPCQICGKIFQTRRYMKHHKKQIHQETETSDCGHCGKSFKEKRDLKLHILSKHDELKTEICEFCGKGFSAKRLLDNHTRAVHRKTPKFATHLCDQCDFKGFTTDILLRHKVRVHGAEKLHECSDCGKTFAAKSLMSNHRKMVHERITVKCNVCNAEFSNGLSMRRHHKTVHLGEKPFKCEVCEKTFGLRHSLKRHLKCHFGNQ